MTAERKAMTLERAMEFLDRVNRGLISGRISEWPGLREACGVAFAHLSRDEEPVARVELDETSHAYVKWLCGIHECIGADLYTHSPETARDAARYRFWRKHYSAKIALVAPSGVAYFPRSRPPVEPLGENYEAKVDAAIDAAMQKETNSDE